MASVTPPDNGPIADRLDALAALLELAGASPYSARAYRRAADLIRSTPAPVAELVRAGRARELRGIGPSIEARLRELVETGELAELRELEQEVAPELVALGRLLGVGPARMVEVGRAFGADSAAAFREAVEAGRLQEVPGIGPETERKIRAGLASLDRPRPRRGLLLGAAWALAAGVAEALGGEVAGDPRRWRETCERFSVVCRAADPEPLIARFASLPQIVALLERSERRALGVTVEGVPFELVVAPPGNYGTELVRATGSADWVAGLEPLPEADDEEGVFAALGRPLLPPELREAHAPPLRGRLLELGDVRGDLHCHTTWSDGKASVLQMGTAARERGYAYLAVCDHTRAVRVVPGLDADELRRQGEEIGAANAELAPFTLLRGAECDILPDGSLDLPDDVLAELEWVQISLHAGQRAPRRELTARVVEAMRHPAASCLSHPTGRLLNHRPPNALDLERVLEAALDTGVALEVNGLPSRLDLRDEHVRLAREAGVPIVVSTDAHSVRGLDGMRLAVATARRGGAEPGDALNTLPLAELRARRSSRTP
ncbi:MAG: DNA polymerase III [Actinobacteria bacterium]|nr:DNA polymerase III [Actinomycetota bacterium]